MLRDSPRLTDRQKIRVRIYVRQNRRSLAAIIEGRINPRNSRGNIKHETKQQILRLLAAAGLAYYEGIGIRYWNRQPFSQPVLSAAWIELLLRKTNLMYSPRMGRIVAGMVRY
ncbi:MAG: hypothetical protein COT15_02315 [Candidatus Diapherotrites archaeon CG08_land_8_20_14_0_20_34_12]|nr:MAG: hypothetical protein COT15_02315 [Candidatus Diapherotrites archaeon CG08_land_8_20_14_0_20_34_12]